MSAIIPQFAKGFAEDASRIIINFKNHTDSSFQCFSDIWKQMKFAQIFTGRRTAAEVMEISEDFLNIAKYFSIYIDDSKIKIGGLFLLYSLYYSQPLVNFAKIRLLNNEWLILKEWWIKLDKDKDDEAIYIFLKLYYDNAFKFVFDNYSYGLEKYYLKNFKDIPITISMPYHMVSENFNIRDDNQTELKKLSESVVSLGEEYKNLRHKLNFQTNSNNNIANLLNDLFKDTAPVKQLSSENESETEAESNEKLGLKRRAIKQKAFGLSGSTSQTDGDPEKQSTSNEEDIFEEESD